MGRRLLLSGLLAALLITAALLPQIERADRAHRPPPIPAGTVTRFTAVAHPEIGFRSRERLRNHFRKHGRDLGLATVAEYLHAAQALRDAPAGGDILEAERRDGVICRYDRVSGSFLAFNTNLKIRTFFRPNDGEAYFHRQFRRGGP